ncbi:MAG: twin-arginine translocase subunit TatC [Magnetococcus sp. WYHC-3]
MTSRDGEPDHTKAPLVEHLIELRNRLSRAALAVVVGFVLCLSVSEELYAFLNAPLRAAMGADFKMVFTALHEAFFTDMKLAFFSGLFLAMPYVLVELWLFVSPGLYKNEKRLLLPFLVITPVLFFLGAAFAFVLVLPPAFKFLLDYGAEFTALPKVSEYLSLVIHMLFAFGLAFELPVLLVLLVRTGVVSVAKLVHVRRYAIVGAFVVGGILTPPDPLSQILLAVPLLAMYEISILVGRMIEKRRQEDEQRAEADADAPDPDDSDPRENATP